jgi:hypothetical protein
LQTTQAKEMPHNHRIRAAINDCNCSPGITFLIAMTIKITITITICLPLYAVKRSNLSLCLQIHPFQKQ